MKLFQRLLVAPAALGLMAPMAATAAELNINGVSDYSATSEEVKSISQFSDVYPTDWAYQALVDLAERHNCVAANPSGAMTRYEAAALLNTCLANVVEANTEERRLLNEFRPELAVIKGRVDGLESRLGEYEAGMFSTTTKLNGKITFAVGAVKREDGHSQNTATAEDALTFSYAQKLDLKSSFNGRDLLYTRIKAGNYPSILGDATGKTYGTYLASSKGTSANYAVDKLWYQFPAGDFTIWAGPRIENYYMLASAPSIYQPVLKGFALGGNGATYGASTGAGFGAAWTQPVDDPSQPRFAVSANHVSGDGHKSDHTSGGMLTDSGLGITLVKVEYGAPRWQASVAYAKKGKNKAAADYYTTSAGKSRTGDTDAIAFRAYWKPEETGLIPEASFGYDIANVDDDGTTGATQEAKQWMIGLGWKDAFIDGNKAGFAFGQKLHATEKVGGSDDLAENPFIWELYYSFKVSDNISITPAIFGANDASTGTEDDIFGGVVQTVFKF